MTTVNNVIGNKGNEIYSVRPDDTVYHALEVMAEHNIGAVMVVREDNTIAGILSERDYARKIVLLGKSSVDTPVRDIMTSKVITVGPNNMMKECMAIMTDNRIRHLPVTDEEGHLQGIISIGDVVKAIMKAQENTIEQLEGYIQGSSW